jgi:dolichyl-diphosphooligosaccharide---protein glycosyltransferase
LLTIFFFPCSDGYQISAIANRTTLADGNTWNHEHIALLGKALTTNLDEGWEIARHLADYVLIWGGGGGDDLAKSPHLARIANSVYRDHCPDDPTCRAFGFVDRQGTPSAMMRRSLLYNLHGRGIRPDVVVSEDRFVEVFRSMYGKVRIYKIVGIAEESKQWVLDHRQCDVKGSWFCPGKYPPGLKPFLEKKTDFRQLEDFNKAGADDEYQKNYFKDLQNPEFARKKIMEKEYRERKEKKDTATDSDKDEETRLKQQMYKTWEDSEAA